MRQIAKGDCRKLNPNGLFYHYDPNPEALAKMIQPREDGHVKCLECGKWFRALPRHLRISHEMEVDDYRLKFCVPASVPLVCLDWSRNQAEANIERDAKRTLASNKQQKGYSQRQSVRQNRRSDYLGLAKAGSEAAKAVDRTATRLRQLEPYPITADQAIDRLGCTARAAYSFLFSCVKAGRLVRLGRGTYDKPAEK